MVLQHDVCRRMLRLGVFLLPLVIMLVIPPILALTPSIKVIIKNSGVVYVEISGVVKEGLNEISLPIQPIPVSLEVYINNTLIPSILINNSIYVPSPGSGSLVVKYIANTTIVNGKSMLAINKPQKLTLIIEPGVVLLTIPNNIVKTRYENGKLIIVFHGPTIIEYTITTLTAPASPHTPTKEHTKEILHEHARQIPLEYVAIVGIVVIVIILTIVVRKGRGHEVSEKVTIVELDEVDKMILEKLKAAGGEALQCELRKKLNVPKTTLWRHIKRLEKLGYIEVKKEGRVSKLILRREVKRFH